MLDLGTICHGMKGELTMDENKGLTFFESVLAIAVISILALIIVPYIMNIYNQSKCHTDITNAKEIATLISVIVSSHQEYQQKDWTIDFGEQALEPIGKDLIKALKGKRRLTRYSNRHFTVTIFKDGHVEVRDSVGVMLFPIVGTDYMDKGIKSTN